MCVTWRRSDNKNLLKSVSTLQMYVQLRYYDDIHACMYRILHTWMTTEWLL